MNEFIRFVPPSTLLVMFARVEKAKMLLAVDGVVFLKAEKAKMLLAADGEVFLEADAILIIEFAVYEPSGGGRTY